MRKLRAASDEEEETPDAVGADVSDGPAQHGRFDLHFSGKIYGPRVVPAHAPKHFLWPAACARSTQNAVEREAHAAGDEAVSEAIFRNRPAGVVAAAGRLLVGCPFTSASELSMVSAMIRHQLYRHQPLDTHHWGLEFALHGTATTYFSSNNPVTRRRYTIDRVLVPAESKGTAEQTPMLCRSP